jgi:hypothetical protein
MNNGTCFIIPIINCRNSQTLEIVDLTRLDHYCSDLGNNSECCNLITDTEFCKDPINYSCRRISDS